MSRIFINSDNTSDPYRLVFNLTSKMDLSKGD